MMWRIHHSYILQRLIRDKGADAFKPMDEDRSVIEYARAGQSLCLNLMGQVCMMMWRMCDDVTYVYDDVIYVSQSHGAGVYDDVTHVYDDVTYVYDDVIYVSQFHGAGVYYR